MQGDFCKGFSRNISTTANYQPIIHENKIAIIYGHCPCPEKCLEGFYNSLKKCGEKQPFVNLKIKPLIHQQKWEDEEDKPLIVQSQILHQLQH
jgi:hypothetical protein